LFLVPCFLSRDDQVGLTTFVHVLSRILFYSFLFFFYIPEFAVSPLATVEELETTHSKDYIQRFLKGDQTELEQRNVGFPWSTEGVDRALSSVGGTLAAACSICEELLERQEHDQPIQNDDNDGSVSVAAVMPPWAAHVAGGTHHAFYDYGEGFSVFSDIAVAANVVLERYPNLIKRILIIDLDVHQGNGNAVLFQGRPEVSTFSIQCEGNYFSEKQTSDLDVELPIGCNDGTYLTTLHHWLKRIETLTGPDHFDMIFFQAGVDILEDDRLGRMDISAQGVRRRNQFVYDFARRLNLPLVICMGGGYPRNTDDWTPIIDAHTTVYFQAHQYLSRIAKGPASSDDD
jgi:acetoin utilization deacetylase AcuC-like enzyme